MKYENVTYENTVALMLCQINNRLAEIAATLQLIGLLDAEKEDGERQKWYDELTQLLQAQGQAIATVELAKAQVHNNSSLGRLSSFFKRIFHLT